MKIAITGASGLVGRKLGQKLAIKGYEILVLGRNITGLRESLAFPFEFAKWDAEAGTIDNPEALEDVDVIVNLAGTPVAGDKWNDKIKKQILDTRVNGTIGLLSAVTKLSKPQLKTIVNASAIGFYGDRGDTLLDETQSPGEGFLPEVCKKWEYSLFESEPAHKLKQLRKVALRIGIVLARDGGALSEMLPIFRKGVGGSLSSGRQWMSWIHIDDLVEMIVFAIENTRVSGIYNAVAPSPVQNSEFTKILAREIGRPAILPAPSFALKAVLGDMSAVVLSSQRVSSAKMRSAGFSFKYNTLDQALKPLVAHLSKGQELLESEVYIDRPLSEVFPFFSSVENLEKLTPEFLNFHVLGKNTEQIEEGTLIDYKLKVHGLPVKWRTKILEWQPPYKFVDTQLKGPYDVWHHTHEFQQMGRGTLMTDRVYYKVPVGALGRVVAGWLVDKDVKNIFNFRLKTMLKMFPDQSEK